MLLQNIIHIILPDVVYEKKKNVAPYFQKKRVILNCFYWFSKNSY